MMMQTITRQHLFRPRTGRHWMLSNYAAHLHRLRVVTEWVQCLQLMLLPLTTLLISLQLIFPVHFLSSLGCGATSSFGFGTRPSPTMTGKNMVLIKRFEYFNWKFKEHEFMRLTMNDYSLFCSRTHLLLYRPLTKNLYGFY